MAIRTSLLLGILLGAGGAWAGAQVPAVPLIAYPLPNPAPADANQFSLTKTGGTVWLTWLQGNGSGPRALRCAAFDSSTQHWRRPLTIAVGHDFMRGPDERPALAANSTGLMVAAWSAWVPTEPFPHILMSQSVDGGAHWSAPALWSAAHREATRPGLIALADERIAAVWLARDPRAPAAWNLSVQPLQSSAAAAVPDPAANAGSQPVLAPLLDGGLVIAFAADRPGLIAQPRFSRWHRQGWTEAQPFDSDLEDKSGAQGDGPALAADGGRIAAVWPAGQGDNARLLASLSPDAGVRFQMPVTVGNNEEAPSHPAVALLHDGAFLVIWESGGRKKELRLGRMSPDLRPTPAPLTLATAPGPIGSPQIVLLHDYTGNPTRAEVMVGCLLPGQTPALRLLRVSVDEGALLAAANDDCRCAPTSEQLQGYSVRGTITARTSADHLTLDLDAAPGLLEAGPHSFHVSAATAASAQIGRQALGRIERLPEGWRLFDLRLLEEPR